jgi:hypothetical protein
MVLIFDCGGKGRENVEGTIYAPMLGITGLAAGLGSGK